MPQVLHLPDYKESESVRTERVARGRPRSERSRRAILDAAAKLLIDRGYADITIEGVAAEAGVGKTTIYRWWSTKAAIYIDLYSELASQIVPPPDTGSVERDLTLLVQGAFKLYRDTAAGLALAGIVAEAQSNATVSNIVRAQFVPSRRHVTLVILRRAVKRGQISSDLKLEVVSELITGAVWFYLLAGKGPLTARRGSQLVKTIMAGIPLISESRPSPKRLY
ncbi:MAG: TetR/AcrR family transcriptional regulator [Burkholderiaceae bacterium]